ncbi:hypothetical protein BN946_scf184977.g88 [Trametes cinnabarina]|uniref:F-box domain-containing protein n=1 Tax=Pycnoporus cinnabarinus TaxID=5643 RepID=A0A060SJK2_PYCCI|nr:hypothetical protein BN946_scf184977.g88 [Trametes cinnabarina]
MDTTRPALVLVDDLIPIILESDDHWWPRDFQRLALISPAWVVPVRRRLYAHPSLRSYRACQLLARTFQRNPDLLSYVRTLELRPISDQDRTPDEREMQSLRTILGLKGLRSVTLGGDLAVAAQRFLNTMADTRTVEELHVDGCMLSRGQSTFPAPVIPSLEWDDAMAFRFPNIRTLRLSNVALTVIPAMMAHPSRLTHLILNNVDLEVGFLPDLCHGSWESLRVLTVIGGNGIEMEDGIRSLLEFCPGIETLRYEASDCAGHLSIFDDDMPSCPNLRNLHLSGFDVNPQTLQAIAQTCLNLDNLAVLGRTVRVTLEEWASFISSSALPHLRRLVAPSGTNLPPFTFWSSGEQKGLLEICDAKGVALSSPSFKSNSAEDW